MQYCKRCLYPANARPTIHFDDQGICSGCRYQESKAKIDWAERWKLLVEITTEAKAKAREAGRRWDCIVPVSGGKDSHYQVWLLTKWLGMNPLLVWFNHAWNTPLGLRNLRNLVVKSGCDLASYDVPVATAKKLSRYTLLKPGIGDPTWHYHAGIMTYPIQVAVEKKIPLIMWGEEGFSEIVGLMRLDYLQEFTKWKRTEHSMRGLDVPAILSDPLAEKEGITEGDLRCFVYPDDEKIDRLELRGLYLGNFIPWDALEQVKLVTREWDFHVATWPRERTFNQYAKTDDHCQGVHDWMRYLKFGYGRCTDDASTEIRHGRLTRVEGARLVVQYDQMRPASLDRYLSLLGLTEEEVLQAIEPDRDTTIWRKEYGQWRLLDDVGNHVDGSEEVAPGYSIHAPENADFYNLGDVQPGAVPDGPLFYLYQQGGMEWQGKTATW